MMRWFILSLVFVAACGDMIENNPERIEKLRAIGVAADQAVYTFSTPDASVAATLSFFVATNLKEDIEVSNTSLENVTQLTLGEPTVSFEDYEQLRLYRIDVSTTMPLQEELSFGFDGNSQAYYALLVRQGGEEERIRGRLKIYPPTVAEGLNWTLPSISISNPQQDASTTAGTVNLKAELTPGAEENYRISWFVAEGEIEQNRKIETEWQGVGAGRKTVIVTARGLNTLSFAYDVIEFDAN